MSIHYSRNNAVLIEIFAHTIEFWIVAVSIRNYSLESHIQFPLVDNVKLLPSIFEQEHNLFYIINYNIEQFNKI